jgi:hypothetical protein
MTAHPLHLTVQKLTRTNSKGQRVTKYRAFVRGRDLAKPITRVWPTMSLAREWGRQYLSNPELAFQAADARNSMLLGELLDRYLSAQPEKPSKKWTGIRCEFWRRELGHKRLRDIRPGDVHAALMRLRATAAPARRPGRPWSAIRRS